MKEFLPIGSVVKLHGGSKKIMIAGRLQRDVESEKLYDYSAVLWPEGYIDSEHLYLFNHEDIDQYYHIGMQDVEEFSFRHILEEEAGKEIFQRN